MFNNDLTPMYDGRVLMNKTAMQDPVVKATLDAMAKRNFEPQRLNAYGVWYISDRHQATGSGYHVRPNPTSQASVSDPSGRCSLI